MKISVHETLKTHFQALTFSFENLPYLDLYHFKLLIHDVFEKRLNKHIQ